MFIKTSKFSPHFEPFLLFAAFAGSALIVWPRFGDSVREPKWVLLQLVALAIMLHNFFRVSRILKQTPAVYWAFLIFAAIQGPLILGEHFSWAILGNIIAMIFLGQFFLAGDSPDHNRWKKYSLIAITLPNGALALLQMMQLDPIFYVKDDRFIGSPVGFIGQHTFFGLLMCLLALICLAKKQRPIFAICFALVLLSSSAFSVLSFAAGFFGWLLWRKHLRLAALFGAAAFVIAILGLLNPSGFFFDNGRYITWRFILDAVIERPWLGYGFGSFGTQFHTYHQGFGGTPWLQAHNEYLELLFDTGVIGLIFGMSVAIFPFLKIRSWWGQEEMLPYFLVYIALLTNALGNFPFHLAPFALYGITAHLALSTYRTRTGPS